MNNAQNTAYDLDGLLTSDPLKCVWMLAKVIDYKLCDRSYDCEHCVFDQVIRSREVGPADQPARFSEPAVQTLIQELRVLMTGARPDIGLTLQDGGTPVEDAGHLIEARQLQQILDKFLSATGPHHAEPSEESPTMNGPGVRR
jgi:hypothetical protein